MKSKKLKPSVPFEPFILKELKDPKGAFYFLCDAIESGDVSEILQAVALILKAQNKTKREAL